jgi:hypothetical protein
MDDEVVGMWKETVLVKFKYILVGHPIVTKIRKVEGSEVEGSKVEGSKVEGSRRPL